MKREFRKGKKVICVDNSYSANHLTNHKEYKILRFSNKYLDIKGDDGWIHRFHNSRFEMVNKTIKLWTYTIKK